MTLPEMIPAMSLVISAIALVTSWRALDLSRQWNKINSIKNFVDEPRAEEILDKLDIHLHRLNISNDRSTPLTEVDAQRLLGDKEGERAINRVLTYFERLSAAVNVGAINDELAYQFSVGAVLSAYRRFSVYIRLRRARLRDREVFCELETLAKRWGQIKATRKNRAPRLGRPRRSGLKKAV
ncbi:DUF4760 domain-containing protein (plasmid) [Brevundimonas staleyi]|uniref:DUF4760 domain-containing protein n=1 Tax=Brevundimonas staleyi TaxID=74326 RepID=A0ABW0FPC5_9CAUL